jgi:alpha-tubulin suppressor-like RCC1 family protein
VLDDGTAHCWGRNDYGQLGDGTTTSSGVPTSVSGLTGVVAVTAAAEHTCAVLDDGTAHCWGRNDYGQLGDGTTTSSGVPTSVSGLTGVVAVTANSGVGHSCAVLDNGTAHCWGLNNFGQLGDGTTTNSNVPVAVEGLP